MDRALTGLCLGVRYTRDTLRAGHTPDGLLFAPTRRRGSWAMTKTPLPTHPLGEAADVISWVDQELAGCRFRDDRLGQRLRKLPDPHGRRQRRPSAGLQDWANTEAAYRFLSNPKVSDHEILKGRFQATRTRLPPSVALSGHSDTDRTVLGEQAGLNATAGRQRRVKQRPGWNGCEQRCTFARPAASAAGTIGGRLWTASRSSRWTKRQRRLPGSTRSGAK